MMKRYLLLLLITSSLQAQLYFPPGPAGQWDTLSPQSLNWCPEALSTLDSFLLASHSKSFIILKNGRIVHEAYYGSYTQDSVWYWASAGKTLKAFLIGKAQEDGFLSINDTSSKYLGNGWTSAPAAKESLITLKDQLQMTTGLDYLVADLDCTADSCLLYKADAGSQWFYHNAPYLLLKDVLEVATGNSLNRYTQITLAGSIGFRGLWFDNLYFSNARQMARFGLLLLGEGVWDGQTILGDSAYFNAMVASSQNLNPAYGYLTWLNGKNSFIQPGLPVSFNGAIIPSAPSDLYMAAGKNDQRIYVAPSEGIVVVRQGNAAGSSVLALSSFDNQLWSYIAELNCNGIGLEETAESESGIYPNPGTGRAFLPPGKSLHSILRADGSPVRFDVTADLLQFQAPAGLYFLRYSDGSSEIYQLR